MLTSIHNSKVKEWKKLHKRKYRTKEKCFLVEGHHLVEEVLRSDFHVKEIILREGTEHSQKVKNIPMTVVSPQVFAALAETETPQGIAAVVEQKQMEYVPSERTLIIDAVQDPGNLGTMIRTADAAGFNHIILGTGTVDVFNDKVIRATQGSLFHVQVFQGDIKEYVSLLKKDGASIWAAALTNAVPYKEFEAPGKIGLIVGNEGKGIQEHIAAIADKQVYIPIYGKADSLNVAVASAVLMYHLRS